MIDWLTLRIPISHFLAKNLEDQFFHYVGWIERKDSSGNIEYTKPIFNIDNLRSDAKGIYWQIQNTGKDLYLVIGASPASIEFNNNVFGTKDIRYCADLLIKTAQKHLAILMPLTEKWECRRIDITENYLLDDNKQVKQALRDLRQGDGTRQKATSLGGDTVYWGSGSNYITGKAYDKGTQAEFLDAKAKKNGKSAVFAEHILDKVKRLLRLEVSLKRQWLEKHGSDWLNLTSEQLTQIHTNYFSQFIGTLEVTDMTTLLQNLQQVAPSKGYALSAHRTWALIKSIGYENTKQSMPKATFCRHIAILKLAGMSSSDLQTATILPFRKQFICISQPVRTWDELLSAA